MRFIGEPSIPSPAPTTCSLLNATINLRCSLEANEDYLLRVNWYHTPDVSQVDSSSVQPITSSEFNRYSEFSSRSTSGVVQFQSQTLVIRGVRKVDYGYWWCRVEANLQLQRTQSRIVGIAAPCSERLPQCIDQQTDFYALVTPRCALDQRLPPKLKFSPLPKCSSLEPSQTRSLDPTPSVSS